MSVVTSFRTTKFIPLSSVVGRTDVSPVFRIIDNVQSTCSASMVFEWAHISDTKHGWKKVSSESGCMYGCRENSFRADSSGVEESAISDVSDSLFSGRESLPRVFSIIRIREIHDSQTL